MFARDERELGIVTDVIIGGYCGSAAGYEELRSGMQQASGNTTLFIESRRWGLSFPKGGKDYPRPLYRQAVHVANILQQKGIWRIRVYGHSMGAAVALIFAEVFGHTFDIIQVVAMSPACLYNDGMLPLARRMIEKNRSDQYNLAHHKDEQVRRIIRAGQPGALRYTLNPVRCGAEGLALARTTLFDLVCPKLANRDIVVAVAYAQHDVVFEPMQVKAALGRLHNVTTVVLEGALHDVQYTPGTTIAALRRHHLL